MMITFRMRLLKLQVSSIFQVHGVLNTLSWGILMPMGSIMARYLKVFKCANPAWFYLHVACQASAYIIGVAGWATGNNLSSGTSSLNRDYIHRNIGITLFSLATLHVDTNNSPFM